MASRLSEVIVDCHDLDVLADFWCAVLGYERGATGDGWLAIRAPGPEPTDDDLVAGPTPPAIAFVRVAEPKSGKCRIHLDVTPVDRSQHEEVARLIALGARHADVGQVDVPWVVLMDPEGNEFCVMREVGTTGDAGDQMS